MQPSPYGLVACFSILFRLSIYLKFYLFLEQIQPTKIPLKPNLFINFRLIFFRNDRLIPERDRPRNGLDILIKGGRKCH